MQVRPEQLPGHLERGLKPVYLVSGDEPLQFNEALDAVRAAARGQGFAERTVLDADTGFDWSRLAEAGASLSLFAERRLIELRLPSGRPGAEGARALAAFVAEPGDDVVLLVGAGRIEARAKRSEWFRAVDRAGACIEVWPKERAALPGWVRDRARARGLVASPEATEELADRCEGNLAYGAQTIERLALLVSGNRIELDDVLDGAAHGARFTSFDRRGRDPRGKRPARIVRARRSRGGRRGAARHHRRPRLAGADGGTDRAATSSEGPRSTTRSGRSPRGAAAGGRCSRPSSDRSAREWSGRLAALAHLDGMSKGAVAGDEWDALRRLVLDFCGVNTAPVRAV